MYKLFLIFPFFLLSQICEAQKAVVALPAMNVVYIGLDNPVKIAVEGQNITDIKVTADLFTFNKIKVIPEGSFITHINGQNYILKVTNTGTCIIKVSYKKDDTLKTESFEFRVKSVPKPLSLFGEFESGTYPASELLSQNTINGTLPNFVFGGIAFTIIHYDLLFVPERGGSEAFDSNSNHIPVALKRLIAKSKKGDKIIIDNIQAVGPRGIKLRLAQIAITIMNSNTEPYNLPDYYTHQKLKTTFINELEYGEIYNTDRSFKIAPGILRGYSILDEDTFLILEVKKNDTKILWEKHYYASGKLKTEYNLEDNDTIGIAKSFYENGKTKSKGRVIVSNIGIFERVGLNHGTYNSLYSNTDYLTDSFLFHNYAPFGPWKGYYENGKVALECTLKLYKYGTIPTKEGDPEFDLSKNNPNKKTASIKEAIESKDGYFKPSFTGSFKLYNRQGQLISEKNY